MNKPALAAALRDTANRIIDENEDLGVAEKDAVEVVRVAARIVLGDTVERAFGAPGDWGYSTPIGKALAEPS